MLRRCVLMVVGFSPTVTSRFWIHHEHIKLKQASTGTYGLAKSLSEGHMFSLEASLCEASASASGEELDELLIAQVEQLLEVNASVRELTERPLARCLKRE